MCKKKGCKYCDYWYRYYEAEDCPRRYEISLTSVAIDAALLTILGVTLLHLAYAMIFK